MKPEESFEDGGLTPDMARELGVLAHAMCAEQRSALLACEDPQRMDLVSLHLWRLLRRRSGLRLEMIQPSGTESLLARFNELMQAMPLGRARSDSPQDADLTVWVLRLSRRLELPEVRLLLKLVQDFPGAGVRLLLMCTREAATYREAADWGSRIHRCRLDPIRPAVSAAAAPSETAAAPLAATTPRDRPTPRADAQGAAPSALRPFIQKLRASPLARIWPHGLLQRWWVPVQRRLGSWLRATAQVVMAAARSRIQGLSLPQKRWAIGVGSVLVSVSGTATAWWHARGDEGLHVEPAVRRPVPEIVELLEDVRPPAVRREQSS